VIKAPAGRAPELYFFDLTFLVKVFLFLEFLY